MSETDPKLVWCAAAVAKACEGYNVYQASKYQSITDVFREARKIKQAVEYDREWLAEHGPIPDKFGVEMLRRTFRAGLIDGRDIATPYTTRSAWRFTTIEQAAAWDAEKALTDGERAERTAAGVRSQYENNRQRYGDRVALWPVSYNLAAVPQDGIEHAIEGGLIRRIEKGHNSGYLVPAEEWDVFAETLAIAEGREARAKAHHDELVARLHQYAGGSLRSVNGLDAAQLEALLAIIEPEPVE